MHDLTRLGSQHKSKKKEKEKLKALKTHEALLSMLKGGVKPPKKSKSKESSKSSRSSSKSKSEHKVEKKKPAETESVKEVTYEQKRELSEKINDLSPDKLEKVYQIIRSGMPQLDTVCWFNKILPRK
jgi:bromodomain-containing factor 1